MTMVMFALWLNDCLVKIDLTVRITKTDDKQDEWFHMEKRLFLLVCGFSTINTKKQKFGRVRFSNHVGNSKMKGKLQMPTKNVFFE